MTWWLLVFTLVAFVWVLCLSAFGGITVPILVVGTLAGAAMVAEA